VNIKELIKYVGKEEGTRLLKQIMENNMMLLNIGVTSSRELEKKEATTKERIKKGRKQGKVERGKAKEMETEEDMGKKKRKSNDGKKMFDLWRFWIHNL